MIRKMYLVFAAFTAVMLLAFCGGPKVDTLDMPSALWMTVPANLEEGSGTAPMVGSTTNNGPAYLHIKSYVRAAKYIVQIGDEIVVKLRNNWNFMLSNKGSVVNLNSGAWVIMKDQSGGGYYLYYGTNTSSTNIYFDWLNVNGLYKGKIVLFLEGTNDIPIEAAAYYDQSLPQRQLDIYAKYDGNNFNKITNIRVLITEISSGEIKIQAMAEYDRSFPMAWNLSAYGKISSAGGAIAYATGKTNTSPEFYATNYIYREYFDSLGYTTWKLGTYDYYTNSGILISSSNVYSQDTYTIGTKPAGIETTILAIPNLANCDYPVLVLP